MKLVLVGHACWLVETADVRILFDPLLFDPNQADCYEVHPSRKVSVEALRSVQIVVVSHRHIDHFDVRSLSSVSKRAYVLCPNDALVVDTLRSIGFRHVEALQDWQSVRFGETTLLATPSENNVPEHGFVISDSGCAIWNQVDSQVSEHTAKRVSQSYDRLNVIICPWQPLMELKFQFNEDTSFPHRSYFELLTRARSCDAQLLVPGASGFRYSSRAEWLNRLAFPVTRDRFIQDLGDSLPNRGMCLQGMDPGDEIVCEFGSPVVLRQASHVVKSAAGEDHRISYCPVDPFANLYTDAPNGDPQAGDIADPIKDLDRFIRSTSLDPYSPLNLLRAWKVVYQLIVCFDDRNCFVNWDFGREIVRVDGLSARATATSIISGRALLALYRGECSWEEAYHSGEWRFFQTVAAVSELQYSLPKPQDIEDVLRMRYSYHTCFERLISGEVERWRHSGAVSDSE